LEFKAFTWDWEKALGKIPSFPFTGITFNSGVPYYFFFTYSRVEFSQGHYSFLFP